VNENCFAATQTAIPNQEADRIAFAFIRFLACNTVEQLAVGVDEGRVRLKPTPLRRLNKRHFCPTTMSKTGSLPFCNAEGYPPIDFSCC
jgi:hypothetical protein